MGLLPSAGDVLVHTIKLSAIPDEYGVYTPIPASFTALPSSVLALFPARNQGSCGACTFFAASTMMTIKYWVEVYNRAPCGHSMR